jgi:TRAP-type C4-dicarboxylate transport system substrate-binding protein
LELIINKAAYESLPADLQAIVEVAAAAANQECSTSTPRATMQRSLS